MATAVRRMRKLVNEPERARQGSPGRGGGCARRPAPLRPREPDPGEPGPPRARERWRSSPAAARAMSRCTVGSSASGCSTPPAPVRSSPRPSPTRWWPPPRRWTAAPGCVHIVKNYTGDVLNFRMAADRSLTTASRSRPSSWTTTWPCRTRCTPPAGAASAPQCSPRRSPAPPRSAAMTWRRSPASHATSTRARARSGSRSRRAPRRRLGVPSSTCPRVRWRWASASTASRAGVVRRWAARREIADLMVEAVIDDLKPSRAARLLVFLNGMGGTPLLELYLMYAEVERRLRAAGLHVVPFPGRATTSPRSRWRARR